MSWFIREEPGSDWLDLSIPTGMLEHALAVTYPLGGAPNPWMRCVERTLVDIAASIFAVAPFQLGLLGEEVSGTCSATKLTTELCEVGGLLVPASAWEAQAPQRVPEIIAPGLVFASFGLHRAVSG